MNEADGKVAIEATVVRLTSHPIKLLMAVKRALQIDSLKLWMLRAETWELELRRVVEIESQRRMCLAVKGKFS